MKALISTLPPFDKSSSWPLEMSHDTDDTLKPLLALHAGERNARDLGPGGPQSIAEGHLLQDRLVASLGIPVVGWKVAGTQQGQIMRGAILAPRLLPSGSTIDPNAAPLLGMEAEIAFRFDRVLDGNGPYDRQTLADCVSALPAIEVVTSRFSDYHTAPLHHRLGDLMSNGFLIVGKPRSDWQELDLVNVDVTMSFGDSIISQRKGGHGSGDPLLPLLALANSGLVPPFQKGQVVTTGTYTGLNFASPGTQISATFAGFEAVHLHVARQAALRS